MADNAAMDPLAEIITRPVRYDTVRHRLWILGQRCHHGAGGAVLAGSAVLGAALRTVPPREGVALLGAAGVLMLHDWKDRSMWFEPGRGSQP